MRLLTAGGIAAHGHIVNVSVSGSFVKTTLPARVLSIVQIVFVAENQRSHVSRAVTAQVVRRTAEGLGLEWCEQVPEILEALATRVASGDSLTITSSTSTYDTAGRG